MRMYREKMDGKEMCPERGNNKYFLELDPRSSASLTSSDRR
jgi:hypothetical protein